MEKNKINIIIRIIVLLPLLWVFNTQEVMATHIVGGNLTYKHISGDLYQVKVVLRRDCFLGSPEADFDNPASVGIFTAGGSLAVWLGNNGQIKMPFMSSDTLNEFIRSDCGFEGTQVCVHETTYTGLVNLPDRPGGYYLAYQRCCRNGSLNNIIDPLETGSTYWTHVTEDALSVHNNAPEFKNWPDIYICANQQVDFDHSAVDADGDSLVYKLCIPSLGATKAFPRPQPPGFPPYDNVIWQSPYGLLDMMGGVPLKIDSKTGKITAIPNLVGQFLIGICVDEYRNGVKIGSIRRDFQYNVRVCSQPPKASFTTTETNCDGLTIKFYNNSVSASAYEWDFNYPSTDQAFKSTEESPSFTFPSIGTYYVRLRATRGSDGCFDTLVQKVIIFNNKVSPAFDVTLFDCTPTNDSLKISLSDKSDFNEEGYVLNKWEWAVTQNGITKKYSGASAIVSLANTGDISVTLLVGANNGCQATLTKLIREDEFRPKADFSIEYPSCPVDDVINVRLINLAKSLNPLASVTSTQWIIGNTLLAGDSALIDIPYTQDSITVNLLTGFGNNCVHSFSKKIKLPSPPSAEFSLSSTVCGGLSITLKNESTHSNTYKWNFNHPSDDAVYHSNEKDPSYNYIKSGIYKIQLIANRTSDGCQDTIIKEIGVFENKIAADFNTALTECEQYQDSVKVRFTDISATNEPSENITLRAWQIVQNGITRYMTGATPELNLSITGDISITLKVTATNSCIATVTKTIKAEDLAPELDFKADVVGCPRKDSIDLMMINLSKQKNPFAGIENTKWTVGSKTISGDSIIFTVKYDTAGVNISLENTFNTHCIKNLVKNITLDAPTLSDFNVTSGDCQGFNVVFENKSAEAVSFEWNFNYPDTSQAFKSNEVNPTFKYAKDGIYQVMLKAISADGCFDTIIKNIPVYENSINTQFDVTNNGCDPSTDKLGVTLTDQSVFNQTGHVINSWSWTVTQNGNTTQYVGKTVDILLSYKGNVEITLEVTSSNLCNSKKTTTYKIDDLIPRSDFTLEFVGCPTGDVADIQVKNLSSQLSPYASIDSSIWLINGQLYNGDSIIAKIPQNTTSFDIKLTTFFNKDCKVSLSKDFNLKNLLPNAAYRYQAEDCPTDDQVRISLIYIDTLSQNAALATLKWVVTSGQDSQSLNGTPVQVTIPKDSLIKLSLSAVYTNGCSDAIESSFVPGPFASLKFDTEPLVLCPDERKPLITNSNPDWTYTWSPTAGLDLTDPKNPLVAVNKNTTYFITVTDGICTVEDSIQVIALSAGVDLQIQSDTFTCDGNITLNASGGMGSGTYTWSKSDDFTEIIGTGQTVTTSFANKKQTYYVKFQGSSCSTKPAKIAVTNEKPQILKVSPIDLCPSDSTKIITFGDNDTHINTYNWYNDPHIISGINTSRPTILVSPADKDQFKLYFTVTNQYNCALDDSILVRILQNPIVDIDVQPTACGKNEVCFTLSNTNVKGFVEWDFGDPDTDDDRSLERSPCYLYKKPGTFSVRLVNLTSTCPFAPVTKTVIVNPHIELNTIRDTTICKDAILSLDASSNLPNIKYEWYDDQGKLLFSGQKYTASYAASSKIVLKGTDSSNCTDSTTINVHVFEFDYDIKTNKDSLCLNDIGQIILNIQNPAQFAINWSPADKIIAGANTATPMITVSDSVLYKVVLKHLSSGCVDSTTFKPNIARPFAFTVNAPAALCVDVPTEVTLTITNPNNYTYDWSPKDIIASGGNTQNPKIIISKNKTLTVKVTNRTSGCILSSDIQVKAADKIDVTIDAIPDLTIFEGESVDLTIRNPQSSNKYRWNTGSASTSIHVAPIITTTYNVTVTDTNGCTAIDDVTVTVRNAKCDESDVYLPNAFSPNNDGNNDVFRLRSNFIDEMELIIYNRWGQEVFHSKDLQQGWDGTFKGEELSPDAYAYFLRVICINKVVYTKRGNVNLIR